MVDQALCSAQKTFFSLTPLGLWIFDVLSNPILVLSLILFLIGLIWMIKRLRRKRLWTGLLVFLLAIYLIVISPIGVNIGDRLLVKFLPSDSGEKADAIVVLGRGGDLRPQRVNAAAALWQAKRAPLIFSSGTGDAIEINQMLLSLGLPKTNLDGEPCSRTTEENAQFTAAILQPKNLKRIILVTDPPHMLRSFLTFQSLGFEVIVHLSPLPDNLNVRQRSFIVFRECLGLFGYGLQGRFLPRTLSHQIEQT